MVGRISWLSAAATLLVASLSVSAAPLTKRNAYSFVLENPYGDAIFELGNISYLANTKHPKAVLAAEGKHTIPAIPVTVIKTNVSTITGAILESVVKSYSNGDDVFNTDFLDGLYISSTVQASLDASAVQYLASFNASFLFVDGTVNGEGSFTKVTIKPATGLPAGPYLATIGSSGVSFATVYRLYPDTYRTFIFGAYETNDGQQNHSPLGVFLPKFWDPMIP